MTQNTMPDTTATPALTRRRLLHGIGGSVALGALWPHQARAGRFVSLRDRQADKILNEALAGDQWWKGASIDRFDRKQYDEIRLRRLPDGGYLAYVSGEGGENFTHEQVVRTVWDHQDKLDNHFESTVTAINLGTGQDTTLGREYRDRYMLLDFGFFYGRQIQRMYRFDLPDGRTLLPFERLQPAFVDAGQRSRYKALQQSEETQARERDDLRSVFDGMVDIDVLYGVFIVEPGTTKQTRVSLIAKVGFSDDSSWLASIGSRIPPVIKSGLRGGFDASVAVCRAVKAGQYD